MQVAWNRIFKKKPRLKLLSLQEMVDVWKICKPFVGVEFEPYLVAVTIYTVSKEKSNKLYRLFYGIDCSHLDDEVATNIAISFGFTKNNFADFIQLVRN